MIQCPTPNRVITAYKPKVVFGLTLRQLVCGGLGIAAIAIGFFAVFKGVPELETKIILSAILGIPFFFVGWGSIYGQPIEKVGPLMFYDNFFLPAVRKKEVHFQALEAYEKTPKFFLPKETELTGNESLEEISKKTKAKPQQQTKQNKIKVKKSNTYKAIK